MNTRSDLRKNSSSRTLSGRFHFARVRLTLVYVALLAAILCGSSYVIYSNFSGRLAHRFENAQIDQNLDNKVDQAQDQFLSNLPKPEDVQGDLTQTLILVNGLLLVIAGIFSYWLAGVTLEPIQEMYERQQQFLGNASHELRTPLAILQTDLENELENSYTKPAEKDRAKSHLEEVQRMSNLVGDLLAITRLDEQGNHQKKSQVIAISKGIEEAVQHFKPIALKHRVTITYLPYEGHSVEYVQKDQFLLALHNIIKNAIIYNKKNGEVIIRDNLTQKNIVVTISDTGVGIPQADLENIFERFYRVDVSRSRSRGGSGLGLSIAESAMKSLNGSIQVNSTVDVGTTITLTIPLRQTS